MESQIGNPEAKVAYRVFISIYYLFEVQLWSTSFVWDLPAEQKVIGGV